MYDGTPVREESLQAPARINIRMSLQRADWMPAPTHFLQDIFRHPAELRRSIAFSAGTCHTTLQRAASAVRDAEDVFLIGIGASWNAMRAQDHAVADDLKKPGASVMLIGQSLPENSEHLVFQLPELPPDWQFMVDIIPVQLAAERLAGLSGIDCDSFRFCSYVVDDEHGLLGKRTEVTKDAN